MRFYKSIQSGILCAALCMLPISLVAEASSGGDNIRLGDLRMNLRASVTQTYDSNIGYSRNDKQADWITQLGLRLGGEMDLTEINTLRFTLGAQYDKYWKNSEYDTHRNYLILTPETELELLFQVGNFDFRLYDEFSMLSDPGDRRFFDPNTGAEVSNIILYNRIRNRLGLDGIWTINPFWSANGGISRLDVIPLDSEFRNLERHSYLAYGGLTHSLAANLDVYGRVSTSVDRWRTDFQPSSSSWTSGVGANWETTPNFETRAFLGWTRRSFDRDGNNQDPTRDASGLTGRIEFIHVLNADLQHSISYDRSIDLGTVSNEITSQVVDYKVDYAGFERSNVFLGISWREGVESGANTPERFDRWSFMTGLGYPLSNQLSFSCRFEHTFRESNLPNREFSRNRASVALNYDF